MSEESVEEGNERRGNGEISSLYDWNGWRTSTLGRIASLVEETPGALFERGGTPQWYPIAFAVNNGVGVENFVWMWEQPDVADSVKRWKDSNGRTLLHIAASTNQEHLIPELLSRMDRYMVNVEDQSGNVPLSYAIWRGGSVETVESISDFMGEALVGRWRNRYKRTFLNYAAYNDRVDLVRLFSKLQPDALTVNDSEGNIPLAYLVLRGAPLAVITEMIENMGIENVKKWRDKYERTVLHCACYRRNVKLQLLRYIFEMFPEAVSIKDNLGNFPISYAIWKGCDEETIEFLAQKTGINTLKEYRSNVAKGTMLHDATRHNRPHLIPYIMSVHPESCGVRDGVYDETPLDNAKSLGFKLCGELLADPERTILEFQHKHFQNIPFKDMVQDLHQSDSKWASTSLVHARHLVELNPGALTSKKEEGLEGHKIKKGYIPIFYACTKGANFDVFRHLCEETGHNVVRKFRNQDGGSLLHDAAFYNRFHIVPYLLHLMGPESAKVPDEMFGETPLKKAEQNNHKKIIKMLQNPEHTIKVFEMKLAEGVL